MDVKTSVGFRLPTRCYNPMRVVFMLLILVFLDVKTRVFGLSLINFS